MRHIVSILKELENVCSCKREFHRILRSIDSDLVERKDKLLSSNTIMNTEKGPVAKPLS